MLVLVFYHISMTLQQGCTINLGLTRDVWLAKYFKKAVEILLDEVIMYENQFCYTNPVTLLGPKKSFKYISESLCKRSLTNTDISFEFLSTASTH